MSHTMTAIAVVLLLSGVSAKCTDKKPLTFQKVAMGEIEDKAATNAGFQTRWWSGAHFGFTGYKASNGNALAIYYDDFDKPEEAKRFLIGKQLKLSKCFRNQRREIPMASPLSIGSNWFPSQIVQT